MPCPDPERLRARKRYGREEYVQEMLACLIVGGEPPKWNQSVRATARGERLLRHIASRADLEMAQDAYFVNEFELLRRADGYPSGWPDFGFYTDTELLLIELKTEPGSHRLGQLAYYDELAKHHHPAKRRRLVYLTPPLRSSAIHDAVETTHLLLDEVRPLITEIWTGAPDDERRLSDYIVDFLHRLNEPWATPAPTRPMPAPNDLRALADETARDGRQRAADVDWASPTDAERARIDLRDELNAAGMPVQAWIWNQATSGGKALTDAGARVGIELRFSRKGPRPSSTAD